MRRSWVVGALIGVAVVVLVGIGLILFVRSAPTETAQPSVTATNIPTSPPTQTATPLHVAPAGTPPVVFAHDCHAMLTEAQVSATTGLALTYESGDSSGTMANVGGLQCSWRGDPASLTIEAIPQSGVGDAEFPSASVKYYFEDCDPQYICSFRWESRDLWIAGTFQFAPDMTRHRVDAWGKSIGRQIQANFAAEPGAPWVRDRTGWWATLDCAAAGVAIARELGTTVSGAAVSIGDPPMPGYVMAGEASHRTDCAVSQPEAVNPLLILSTSAGTGASTPEGFAPVDLGVHGVDAYLGGPGSFGGVTYYLTDKVNSASVEIAATARLSAETVAKAVAAAAASGFH
jgi:hypothetical protein